MNMVIILINFVVANILTLYYGILVLLSFLVQYLKNPFGDPWARKLRLEPPPCLSDPKYGEHTYIKVNNITIHYVESGDPSKPLMIFVHGFPEFWYSWRHQIIEFNKDYWCIAIDMRGYGDSEKPEEQSAYKIELLVEDIRELLRMLGREKCILIGHDWGSLIVTKFRDLYPDAISALVILGGSSREAWTATLLSDYDQFKKSWYVFMMRLPWLPEMLLEMNDMEIFDKTMRIAGKESSVTVQDIECYKYRFGKPTAFTPPVNYYRANFSYKKFEKPKCELPVPFLAIHGGQDLYISAKNLDALKRLYASIQTVILKDCSHFLMQEKPEEVNSVIKDFLSSHKI